MEKSAYAFEYVRVEKAEDVPPASDRIVDVAILDMNHRWPNLGHDSMVRVVRGVGCDLIEALELAGLELRVLSFDIRSSGVLPNLGETLPETRLQRFPIHLGTGGPGHLDPRKNDGYSHWSQGIQEDPSWEAPLFEFFDRIAADERLSMLAVCHTFGLLCRWSGAATPQLRGPEKGGKSSGVLENVLTDTGKNHPWFSRFSAVIPDGRRFRVLDSRLFDLIPKQGGLPRGSSALGFETNCTPGNPGEAITMIEFARDKGGVMPRIFGVNHHPEILQRESLMSLLELKYARGEVTTEWFDERVQILTTQHPGEDSERLVALTSYYTLVAPLRFHLTRAVRERGAALGIALPIHENETLVERTVPTTQLP